MKKIHQITFSLILLLTSFGVTFAQSPTVVNDSYIIYNSMTLTDNLLTNDSLVLGSATISFTSAGNYGAISLTSSTGDFSYIPNNNIFSNVIDTLTYEVCNAPNLCNSAFLIVTVQNTPQPIADNFTFIGETGNTFAGNLLTNDIFPILNGVPLVVASLYPNIPPSHGIVVINTDGTFTYTPDSTFTASDIFKYSLCSTQGMNPPCDTATVYINVLPSPTGNNTTTEISVAYGSTLDFYTPTFPILDSMSQGILYACDTLNNAYLQNNSAVIGLDSSFTIIPTSIGSDTTCIHLIDGTIQTVIVNVIQGVWPGDTDTSALVNHWDLLNIGLAYGSTGAVRPNASTTWGGYVAQDWLQNTPVSLIDYKHIDTDGNGVIDDNDTLAISQNWGQSYTKNGSGSNGTIPLYVDTDTLIANNGVVTMPIILGSAVDPAVDCYGVAFTVRYDNNLIKDSTVTSIDFTNSWLGILGQDAISIQKDFSIDGEIQVAITRIDGNNLTGFGQIGTLRYTIQDDIMRNSNVDFDFTIKDVKVIAFDELPLDIDAQTTALSIDTTGVSTRNIEAISTIAIFPNPATSQLNIQSDNEPIESVTIFTFDGKQVENFKINNTNYSLNVTNYSAGLYVIRIKTLSDTIVQRFIKLK